MRDAFLAAASFLSLSILNPIAAAQQLRVDWINVGQGSSTLITGPTGKTLLVDAGENGYGTSTVKPFLQSRGITHLDFLLLTHYHTDHMGGIDEVWNGGITATLSYDRGELNPPSNSTYTSYKNAIGATRRTIAPGQILDLGGGATAQCITVAGYVYGFGQVDINGSSQYENSASIGLVIRYGDFEMWVGGDLTGGVSSTTDVETPAGPRVGDIEVYTANHHGSLTSSNQNWINATQPEVTVFSCGDGNSYGHPSNAPVNRLNSATRSTLLYCTTPGAGSQGFVNGEGRITLLSDGTYYTITPAVGPARRLLCDEKVGKIPTLGELAVTEYFSRPTAVSSSLGQYFEIQNKAPYDRTLRGLRFSADDGQSFTFQSAVLLAPGERFVLAAHGDRLTNGGFSASAVWPFNSYSLTPGADAMLLREGAATVEDFRYTASFPDPSGKAVERKSVVGAVAAPNFAAATSVFANGQYGTPGAKNSVDNTDYPGLIEVVGAPTIGGSLNLAFSDLSAPGLRYYVGLGGAAHLGLGLGKVFPVPIGQQGFLPYYRLPGFVGYLPGTGYGQCSLAIANDPSLVGTSGLAGLMVVDQNAGNAIVDISAFVPWTIQ